MKIHSTRILVKSKKHEYTLHPLGDIHAGVVFCAEKKIKERVQEIKDDPRALWVGMGDYVEAISPNDRRWDVGVISPWVEQTNVVESQRKWIKNLFEPIKDKCIGLLTGNHEEVCRLHNYQDIHLDLCRDLGVMNLGYSCFVRLLFERSTSVFAVTCHFEHGAGGAQTEGGKIMRLTKGMLGFEADIYGMGHLHDIKINTISRLHLTDSLKIKRRVKVGAITGCWFIPYIESEYPSYAELKGYSPSNIGAPVFVIHPYKRELKVIG